MVSLNALPTFSTDDSNSKKYGSGYTGYRYRGTSGAGFGSLSDPVKIAIFVIIAVVGLIFFAIVGFCLFRRYRREKRNKENYQESDVNHQIWNPAPQGPTSTPYDQSKPFNNHNIGTNDDGVIYSPPSYPPPNHVPLQQPGNAYVK